MGCFSVKNSILYEARHLLQSHGTSPDIDNNVTECEDYLHRLLTLCNEVGIFNYFLITAHICVIFLCLYFIYCFSMHMCLQIWCYSFFIFSLLQPQNTIPDVVVWMLSGGKRVASCRIPSHKLMYSTTAKARGQDCGKIQTLFLTVSLV